MAAGVIQICGTGSGVGKSVVAAGLCRILIQDGYKTAPFKAQNMSLNSFVTHEGGEIGRAQAMQAAGCRLKPSVDMNPILLKPTSDKNCQIIVGGKPVGNMSALEYKNYKKNAWPHVLRSFTRLKKHFDAVVIEGAGSPAEVNLKSHDIVNMKMAEAADAPVILVGDIDKGGVFAWLVGTLELLTSEERKRVKGFIINKFRGDKRLLKPGLEFLKKKTGKETLGVIPYFTDIKIPEEDSAALEGAERNQTAFKKTQSIEIVVIKLPHISNFTDFDALKSEPDVRLRYAEDGRAIGDADVIVLPGTKNTIADLAWLKKVGLAGDILAAFSAKPNVVLAGICGGFQMLGSEIRDEHRLESGARKTRGLGLLPLATHFEKEKILSQVRGREISTGLEVSGYEIHHGRTENGTPNRAAFEITERQGKRTLDRDGFVSDDGRIWGTYIHGIFDNPAFRRNFLNGLRKKKGWATVNAPSVTNLDVELDKLARLLRNNLDMDFIYELLFDGRSPK